METDNMQNLMDMMEEVSVTIRPRKAIREPVLDLGRSLLKQISS